MELQVPKPTSCNQSHVLLDLHVYIYVYIYIHIDIHTYLYVYVYIRTHGPPIRYANLLPASLPHVLVLPRAAVLVIHGNPDQQDVDDLGSQELRTLLKGTKGHMKHRLGYIGSILGFEFI